MPRNWPEFTRHEMVMQAHYEQLEEAFFQFTLVATYPDGKDLRPRCRPRSRTTPHDTARPKWSLRLPKTSSAQVKQRDRTR
ncbi:hypothetical protein [Actinomadura napierensis]|uniref:hypothetical protein n=1 Tax=Actinomadura napierensis TaxID=267854 RepID=UPI0031D49E15